MNEGITISSLKKEIQAGRQGMRWSSRGEERSFNNTLAILDFLSINRFLYSFSEREIASFLLTKAGGGRTSGAAAEVKEYTKRMQKYKGHTQKMVMRSSRRRNRTKKYISFVQ